MIFHWDEHEPRVPTAPVIAHPTRDTVLQILGAFRSHTPITLLHPKHPRAVDFTPPPGTLAVLFTSGSTGAPKPIALSRAAFLASAAASEEILGDRADDRWLACLPLAHTGGLSVVLRAIVANRPLILHEGDFDAAAVAQLGRDHRATLCSLVPTMLDAMLGEDLPPWRAVLLGGAAAPRALLERARHVPYLRTYGLTETWGQVATARVPGDPDAPLVPLSHVRVTAGTRDEPRPIVIDGPTGHVVTSDLGFFDGPGLQIVGRADDVIVTGGENVHPAEVEAALGHPRVCVFGLPDERWGQIVACAIVGDPRDLDLARLPAHLRPRRIFRLDALPLGATGKIDRRAVAAECRTTL